MTPRADGFLLLRHDRALLAQLPPERMLGALFCCTLADALDALAEMALARHGVSPQALLAREYDEEGDRIDNDLAGAMPDLLRHPPRAVPRVADITQGYGAALIARFVAAETARGVIVIGGLPTDFSTLALNDELVRAIAGIYTAHGGAFLVLPNRSLYPAGGFLQRRGPSGPALPVSALDRGGGRAGGAAAPHRLSCRPAPAIGTGRGRLPEGKCGCLLFEKSGRMHRTALRPAQVRKEGRLLFVNKKKQKTLLFWAVALASTPQAQVKKFLRRFFQKSGCFLLLNHQRGALAGDA